MTLSDQRTVGPKTWPRIVTVLHHTQTFKADNSLSSFLKPRPLFSCWKQLNRPQVSLATSPEIIRHLLLNSKKPIIGRTRTWYATLRSIVKPLSTVVVHVMSSDDVISHETRFVSVDWRAILRDPIGCTARATTTPFFDHYALHAWRTNF